MTMADADPTAVTAETASEQNRSEELDTEYTARFRRERSFWLASIEELPQVQSFGRTLEQARTQVRSSLGTWLEVDDASSLTIHDAVEGVSPEIALDVAEATELRREIERLSARAQECTARAIAALTKDGGLSVRDAAVLLDISHQRVHQLIRDGRHGDRARLHAERHELHQAARQAREAMRVAARETARQANAMRQAADSMADDSDLNPETDEEASNPEY